MTIDRTGPIVLTIELSEEPFFDEKQQWLVEFQISELGCGLTNSETIDGRYVATTILGPYGFNTITNQKAPEGTCAGSLVGRTATLVFNIQVPLGPWSVGGGTQSVEIGDLNDTGSADDVVIEMPPS